jgi:hypothetical protein
MWLDIGDKAIVIMGKSHTKASFMATMVLL